MSRSQETLVRYTYERELRAAAQGYITHHQHPRGAIVVPPDTKNPLGVVQAYRDEKRRISPSRTFKKTMMREGKLSSRQYRKLRKHMGREMKREEVGDGEHRGGEV